MAGGGGAGVADWVGAGAGFFSAMTGGADGGRGTGAGRCAGCDGAAGRVAGVGIDGGASRRLRLLAGSGESETFGNCTDIEGSPSRASIWISTDSAMVTPIRGTIKPSCLLCRMSMRSIIISSLPCRDGFPGRPVNGAGIKSHAKYIVSDRIASH